tara:strand:+ start:449 stop:1144 length:696 start_codon:yes stop_codon:yes gene_type:complete
MLKKFIFILLAINIINGQKMTELTEQNLFRGGNIFLIDKLNNYDSEIDGTPYLNPKFDKGKIIFENGNSYIGDIRIDLVSQNFQIRGKDGKITPIEVNGKVKIQIDGKTYRLHSINNKDYGDIGILRECIKLKNLSLYYFPRKILREPLKSRISAPGSAFNNQEKSEWIEDGFFFFFKNEKYIKVPTKYKKLVDLKIFDEDKLKSFRKTNKLDLKNENKLVALVKYLNQIQ